MKSIEINQIMHESGIGFGTSGVRGLVSEMTDELCFSYTTAFLQALKIEKGSHIAVAMDLRPSSPKIAASCCAAIKYAGMQVDFCGEIPTPALAFYAQEKKIAGVMITGSHIPFDRNGIKFYSPSGEITKQHEHIISHSIVTIPAQNHTQVLPVVNKSAQDIYIQRYLSYFGEKCFDGFTLAFYQHSSVARELLTGILERLGAKVISLGRTNEFVPIDTEAVAKVDIGRAKKWAKEYAFDAIISTDGDADRPLIGDEKGNWMRGDIVGLLTAHFLNAKSIATPVSCNTAIELSNIFNQVIRTRIGSPYVIEAMKQMLDQNLENVVGFEANGGFLLGSNLIKGSEKLSPLCTRDAVLPILSALALSKQKGCKLSQLTLGLPSRYTASDRIQAFPTEKSQRILNSLAISNFKIESLVGDKLGYVSHIDQTDGLRITFEKGEIIHYRPSGNAPELRCYAEASNQIYAEELVGYALSKIQSLN